MMLFPMLPPLALVATSFVAVRGLVVAHPKSSSSHVRSMRCIPPNSNRRRVATSSGNRSDRRGIVGRDNRFVLLGMVRGGGSDDDEEVDDDDDDEEDDGEETPDESDAGTLGEETEVEEDDEGVAFENGDEETDEEVDEDDEDDEDDEGDDGGRMGDWFLSLSSRASDEKGAVADEEEEAAAAASRTIRARLLLHLSIFGALCLVGQSGGYCLSKRAPFLGLSAAAVNVHNVLACVSALMKEEGGKGMMIRSAMTTLPIRSLRKGDDNERNDRRLELTPFVFRLGVMAACVRCIPVCKCICALASGLLLGRVAETTAAIGDARRLSLQVASLARLTLFAGASNALYAATSTCHRGFRHHSSRRLARCWVWDAWAWAGRC